MSSKLFDLTGKTAVVTGASRGLGQAMAVALAEAGAHVICVSSSEGGVAKTVEKIRHAGGSAQPEWADFSDANAVSELATRVLSAGGVDILVNNAGTISRCEAEDFPLDEWHKVMKVNIDSLFLLCQKLGKAMLAKGGGKIINVASLLSFSGGIRVPAYTASKHAVAGLTRALANEWAKNNVQVNAIAPGYFRTDNTQALQADSQRSAEIEARIPAGRWGEPQDLAGAVVFLASSASNYVNGHVLLVDGGWMAR